MVLQRLTVPCRVVRDQANKTIDAYLQRVRKHASTMADTAIPASKSGEATPARMGSPAANGVGGTGSASWTGWVISSWTNKPTTAKGEIQQQPQAQKEAKSQSQSQNQA